MARGSRVSGAPRSIVGLLSDLRGIMTSELTIGIICAVIGAIVCGIVMHLIGRERSRAASAAASAAADRAMETLRTELAVENGRVASVERDRDDAIARAAAVQRRLDELDAALLAVRGDLSGAREALAVSDTERQALRSARDKSDALLTERDTELNRLRGECEEARRDREVAATDRDNLRERLRQQENEVSRLQAELADITKRQFVEHNRLAEALEAARVELSGRKAEHEGLVADAEAARQAAADERRRVEKLQGDVTALSENLARVQAEFASLGDRLAQQQQFLVTARELLTEQFKAASQDVLKANTAFLTDQAKQTLGVEHERIVQQLRPVAESMGKIEELVARVEKDRGAAGAQLAEQLEQITRTHQALSAETRKLVTALRDPKVRGNWGEVQLRRVVEYAGMLEHCDFQEQVTMTADGELQRPDLIVHLAGGKCVVVDAKAPLDAYLAAIEATDDSVRDTALVRHAEQVRKHVRTLASKAYWKSLPQAPDFVVLFLPGEAFLQAALVADHALLEDALRDDVMLASPVTLVTMLKSAAYGWQQERLTENAEAIREGAAELLKRVGVLAEHFADVGAGLKRAVGAYDRAVNSYQRRILPHARTLAALGLPLDDRIAEPDAVGAGLLEAGKDDRVGQPISTALLDGSIQSANPSTD